MSVCLAQPSEWDRKGSTSAIRGVENYSKDAPTTLSALLSPALGIASVDPPPRHPPPSTRNSVHPQDGLHCRLEVQEITYRQCPKPTRQLV